MVTSLLVISSSIMAIASFLSDSRHLIPVVAGSRSFLPLLAQEASGSGAMVWRLRNNLGRLGPLRIQGNACV